MWIRGPGYLGSTEGSLPDLEEGKTWVLLVCKATQPAKVEIYQASDNEVLPHTCSSGAEIRYGGDVGDGYHYLYRLSEIVRGYIELDKTPPEVVTLRK